MKATVEVAHPAPHCFFGRNECFALGCAAPFGLNFVGGNTGAQMGG